MSASVTHELVLTESPTMRSLYRDRIDVLDKVKELSLLPDGLHATAQQVADYYEVPFSTLQTLAQVQRKELEGNGLQTVRGEELSQLKAMLTPSIASLISAFTSQLDLFPRRAILNVGQLLTQSDVAQRIRQYLLEVEATATVDHRLAAHLTIRLQERKDYKNVLEALKRGGAESGGRDYAQVQDYIYELLFGIPAWRIKQVQPQRLGEQLKRGDGFTKASGKIAKNYLTLQQLELLDRAVLAIISKLEQYYPNGATTKEMMALAHGAAEYLSQAPARIA